MTLDDIIRMAVKCHLVTTANREGVFMDSLAEFAQLVAAQQRRLIVQECLYLCESTAAGADAEAIQEAIKHHFGVKR